MFKWGEIYSSKEKQNFTYYLISDVNGTIKKTRCLEIGADMENIKFNANVALCEASTDK